MRKYQLLTGAITACVASNPCCSADISLTAKVEYGYDSSVILEDVDTLSRTGDRVRGLSIMIDAEHEVNEYLQSAVSYSYIEKSHREFNTFNSSTEIFSFSQAIKLPMLSGNYSYYSITGNSDGNKFVAIDKHVSSLSRLFKRRLYMRGGYGYTVKYFDSLPDRNSEVDAYFLGGYFLIDKSRNYLTVSFKETENISDLSHYDYVSQKYKFQWSKAHLFGIHSLIVKVGCAYEKRNYKNSSARKNRKYSQWIHLDKSLSDRLSLEFQVEYESRNSTDSNYTYSRRFSSIGFVLEI